MANTLMMCFETYVRANYESVCATLRQFVRDEEIKSILVHGGQDVNLVKSWMREYGLYRGISSERRDRLARRFLIFSAGARAATGMVGRRVVEEKYLELFKALFFEVNRSWVSATSKLLWCIYPDEVVIYDSFVWRALVVMQCLDADLAKFPRIGVAPPIASESDIAPAVRYYMNYQDMVRHILQRSSTLLNELRAEHKETYPHDVRIIDQLLWRVGNPNFNIKLQ